MLLIYWNSDRWTGGVDVLVSRFAGYLESIGEPFLLIAPEDGWARSEFSPQNLITLDELPTVASVVTHVFAPSVMVLAREFPWAALRDAKIFTYVVHPNDIFLCFFPYKGRQLQVFSYRSVPMLRALFRSHSLIFDRLFDLIVSRGAIAVMDGATARTMQYFLPLLSETPEFLPIPSRIQPQIPRSAAHEGLRVGYLGRMDAMKWSALSPFLKFSLGKVAKHQNVEFFAVSEGSHISNLKSLCDRLRIRLTLRAYMPNDQAREWLAGRCDVAVAMGTSALDLAGSGLPVIVLDPALGVFASRQTKFRYIHDSPDWTLGEYRDFPGYVFGSSSFTDLCQPEKLATASVEGAAHVRRAHDEQVIFEKLKSLIYGSRLLAGEAAPHIAECLDSVSMVRRRPVSSIARSFWTALMRKLPDGLIR